MLNSCVCVPGNKQPAARESNAPKAGADADERGEEGPIKATGQAQAKALPAAGLASRALSSSLALPAQHVRAHIAREADARA